MTEVTRSFCWHQNFDPWGCMPSAPWLYTCIKSWKKKKKLYKIRLQRHFLKLANEWSDKTFLLTSKLCSLGLTAPVPGLYTCIQLWKNCIKSDFKEIFFFNLKQMTKTKRGSCVLPDPAPGLHTCIKSLKKMYKIRLQRDLFENCSKWPKWQKVSVVIKILSR